MSVRVRFAPSPTGSLHVGGARTALYNLLFARANDGKFILRIEDTDQERSTDAALQAQIKDLIWLGLNWDEGPYKQSERQAIYHKIANDFLDQGHAYYCFLSDAEIAELREKKQAWNSPYRDLSKEQSQARLALGEKATIRFRAPEVEKLYKFTDLVRGPIELSSSMVGDFVIIRSDGMPVYNFCCAVDDALMQITHVFRGEEHLSNTLRQLMIYEAMAKKPPSFGHLSIILGDDRKKLSKRQGAVSCDSFRLSGYLPEAVVNYIALLGWSPKTEQELFSLDELCRIFRAEQLNAAAPIFDRKKLDWLNALHLRALSPEDLFARVKPWLSGLSYPDDVNWQVAIMRHLATDAVTLQDIVQAIAVYLDDYDWQAPEGFSEILAWEHTRSIWQSWHDWLQRGVDVTYDSVAEFIKSQTEVRGKYLFMPLRVAVIGHLHGADVRVAAPLISRDSLTARVKICLDYE